ncbi:flavin reductase family protein [Rhodococcus sp. OK302]|uniref:flavin reductase family protein n=1 Tax=Rhodococcus sp. OK302 TaxID=1882769 RepID=UPI000B9431D2|nr:flavin reductase family protein [Rhodococcus sp. OK302]OYD61467.1 flavin reductase (DIM6/NTAB) family NADH-FMN oxidoreductase RutF [Rhodococcus sp. OK302]
MIDTPPPTVDSESLRRTYGCFPSGVVALCAHDGRNPIGMAASSFTSVSLDPPLVSVCVQDTSTTWPRLRASRRIGISVLAEGHDDVCMSLSRKDGDRFSGVEWGAAAEGSVFVHGSTVWLDCVVDKEVEGGDHTIVLFRILGVQADTTVEPLVFHGSRFRLLTGA